MLNVALLGASGRMGRTLVPLVVESGDLRLSGALAAADDARIGQDAGVVAGTAPVAVALTSEAARALEGADVGIEFALPAATLGNVRLCAALGLPIVIGTTGHDAAVRGEIERAAGTIPIVMAPNMSLGVNLLFRLAEIGARALDERYDAEIVEAHHRLKADAPSGTALGLGKAVARGRGVDHDEAAVYARHGATGPRKPGTIGYAVIRAGDIVGDHRVVFAGPGECIELAHHAEDRSGFARGALAAARWVVGRPPRLYSMMDVLGI